MKQEIKSKIEAYVKEGFEDLDTLDPTEDGYYSARGSIIKEISTLVDLLQKEDINENNKKFNNDKIINENTKIVKDHEINLKKIESENDKNKDYLHMENRKIDNDEIKNNSDSELRREELNIKNKMDIELRNDRIIKAVTETIKIVAPIITYNMWMKRGLIFEETGSFTSSLVKNLVNRIKPE